MRFHRSYAKDCFGRRRTIYHIDGSVDSRLIMSLSALGQVQVFRLMPMIKMDTEGFRLSAVKNSDKIEVSFKDPASRPRLEKVLVTS